MKRSIYKIIILFYLCCMMILSGCTKKGEIRHSNCYYFKTGLIKNNNVSVDLREKKICIGNDTYKYVKNDKYLMIEYPNHYFCRLSYIQPPKNQSVVDPCTYYNTKKEEIDYSTFENQYISIYDLDILIYQVENHSYSKQSLFIQIAIIILEVVLIIRSLIILSKNNRYDGSKVVIKYRWIRRICTVLLFVNIFLLYVTIYVDGYMCF